MKFILNIVRKFLLASTIVLALVSCQKKADYEQIRLKGLKDLPQRSDNWFKRNIGKVNEFDKIDPYGNLSREDYQKISGTENKPELAKPEIVKTEMSIPKFNDLLEEDAGNDLINDKLVSISVSDDVPLKEVLIELARRAEVDVEIDKDIKGGIIFIAKDRPFSEVIDRISKIASLTYKIEDGVLKIKNDNPFIRSYKFNVLDLSRNSQSTVTSSFQVGGGGSEGSATVNSGSTSSLDIKSGEGDIWKAIETGINEILVKYKVSADFASTGQNTSGGSVPGGSGILSLNKKAGLITLMANASQHKAIKEYLDSVHIALTSQVLIEAKVLEVTLSDQYSSGINWSILSKGAADQKNNGIYLGSSLGATAAVVNGQITKAAENNLKFSILPTEIFGGEFNLDASVQLLQQFGVTRSLANPRISTMNNQYAVLNFSKNYVYFDVQLQQQQQQATGSTPTVNNFSVTSSIKTVPVGVILGIQPSIDLDRDEISLSVRPTLTRVRDTVQNPGVSIIAKQLGIDIAGLNSDIPVVEVRELDTVFKVRNSQIMVIGGLLEERSNNDDTGLPGFSGIPYIGNIFKKTSKDIETVETVIFMKAQIIPGKGVAVEDENFYKKFTSSRRPFFNE
jgi:general secretion pathway protein D